MSPKINLLPDGTPEDRARMATSAALAEKLVLFLNSQKVSDGTVIEALGMVFGALRSDDQERANKWAADIGTAIGVCFALKEKAKGSGR